MNNAKALMERLESVVDSFNLKIAKTRRAKEWRLRPLLEEAVIPRLNEALVAQLAESGNLHELGASEDEPKDIIHYTKLSTLIVILENQAAAKETDQAKADKAVQSGADEADQGEAKKSYLRMYDTFHLNDPEEGQFLIRHMSQRDREDWFAWDDCSHAYVASFIIPDDCKNQERRDEDNLKYWLAYGQRGRGCSIRFPVSSNRFRRVVYGQQYAKCAAQSLDLRSVWNLLKPLMESQDRAFSSAATEILSGAMWKNLARMRYLYKDASYNYEQECRLVRSVLEVNKGEAHFEPLGSTESPYNIRHYYEDEDLRIDRILVTNSTITLGPLVRYPDSIKYYINTLLERTGLTGPRIEISQIPYQEPWQ